MAQQQVMEAYQVGVLLINGLMVVLFTIGWFFIKGVIKKLDKNEGDISKLKTEVAVNTADDRNQQAQFKEIKEWMVRIDERLGNIKHL